MSSALQWLSCMAWHNSEKIAAPGLESLCHRKHLKQRGAISKNVTRRFASSMSVSAELWHTKTSYFRLHRAAELRAAAGGSGGLEEEPGVFNAEDDDDGEDVRNLSTEEVVCSSCGASLHGEDTLGFDKSC